MKKRILIVDDHPIFRAGLNALLKSEQRLEVIGEASGYREAREQFTLKNPDVVIVDLSLAEGSGLQLIKSIRSENKRTRILVASMHDDLLYAERVLRLGANGYINKAQAAGKIVEAIQVILKGDVYLCPEVANHILQRKLHGRTDNDHDPVGLLSTRELEVFTRIGQGMSSRRIANQLNVSPKTIDSHREHIKHKLGIEDSNSLIQRAVSWLMESTTELEVKDVQD